MRCLPVLVSGRPFATDAPRFFACRFAEVLWGDTMQEALCWGFMGSRGAMPVGTARDGGEGASELRIALGDDGLADLRARIAGAYERAVDALLEYDDIELQQNPEIEADYALKVGRHRDAQLRSELAMLRARRVLRLARSARREGMALGADTLELVVDDEFTPVTRRADERLARYMALIDMRQRAVQASPEEAAAFRALYRRFVAWLHPDLHPDVDELGRRLLTAARWAYADGDFERLRILATRLPDGLPLERPRDAPEEGGTDATDRLSAELAMAEALAGVLEERVAALKRRAPYKYREKLADPNWVAGFIYAGNARIERCDALTQRYRQQLADLLKEGG